MRILLGVDPQRDFALFGGALATRSAEEIIPILNELASEGDYDFKILSADKHKRSHISFLENHPGKKSGDFIFRNGQRVQLFTKHCEENTEGAEFHPDLKVQLFDRVFYKGMQPDVESLSAFKDALGIETGLAELIRAAARRLGKDNEPIEIDITGLYLEYCVGLSAIDSHSLGFKTRLLADATRAIDPSPTNIANELDKLAKHGIEIVQSHQIIPRDFPRLPNLGDLSTERTQQREVQL